MEECGDSGEGDNVIKHGIIYTGERGRYHMCSSQTSVGLIVSEINKKCFTLH
jgi:hypothetical protein